VRGITQSLVGPPAWWQNPRAGAGEAGRCAMRQVRSARGMMCASFRSLPFDLAEEKKRVPFDEVVLMGESFLTENF